MNLVIARVLNTISGLHALGIFGVTVAISTFITLTRFICGIITFHISYTLDTGCTSTFMAAVDMPIVGAEDEVDESQQPVLSVANSDISPVPVLSDSGEMPPT